MTNDIRTIAILYFEGKASFEEEKQLFEFVNSSQENLQTFKSWEEEWSHTYSMNVAVADSYARFAARISEEPMRRRWSFSLWKRVSIAASLIILLVGSSWVVWQWKQSQEETYYTCKVPYGSKTCMELPDGTIVWLNAGSTLRYSTRFNEEERKVELDGEGYFDVKKDNGRLFVVKTKACDIIVKGTRFDVSSYSDDEVTSVALIEGNVQVNTLVGEKSIQPGEKVVVDKQTGKITQVHYEKMVTTWIDNNLDFESITLKDLAKILSRQFNVNIKIESERLSQMKFSVMLKEKETIGDVMQSLQSIEPMKVVKRDKTLYIFD